MRVSLARSCRIKVARPRESPFSSYFFSQLSPTKTTELFYQIVALILLLRTIIPAIFSLTLWLYYDRCAVQFRDVSKVAN
jgi:hypothetical protein